MHLIRELAVARRCRLSFHVWARLALGIVVLSAKGLQAYAFGVPPEPQLKWDAAQKRLEVAGLDAQFATAFCSLAAAQQGSILRIIPVWERQTNVQAFGMLGTYSCTDSAIYFSPQFPLKPGQSYRADLEWHPAQSQVPLKATLKFSAAEPERTEPESEVVAVYPSQLEIPANLLKFYVHFSQPMSLDQAHQHVRLLDGNGAELDGAFLDLREELWDAKRTRLTLLLDPGRIKRGLAPNLSAGPPLSEGQSMTLVVDAELKDGKGRNLARAWRKTFKVGKEDREQPDAELWDWKLPYVGGTDPLEIAFGESLDAALVVSEVQVVDAYGRPIRGQVTLLQGESIWQFLPEKPWRQMAYSVRVSSRLEDLAGNNLLHAFDSEITQDRGHHNSHRQLSFPFNPLQEAGSKSRH